MSLLPEWFARPLKARILRRLFHAQQFTASFGAQKVPIYLEAHQLASCFQAEQFATSFKAHQLSSCFEPRT